MNVLLHLFHTLNPFNSIKAHIAWATAGIVVMLSVSLSYWAAAISTSQIEDRQGNAFARHAHNAAEMLDRGMFERFREMQVAAVLSDIQSPDVSIDTKRKVLERIQSSFNAYAWVGMCDGKGVGLVGTGKYLEGKDLSHRPWCTEGRTKPYVGDVHDALLLAKILPNPSHKDFYLLDVAAPVHRPDGSLFGVLCGHIFWNWAEDMLKVANSRDEESLLLSKGGLVLAGSLPLRSKLKDVAPKTMAAILSGEDGYTLETWADGKTYLTGYARGGGYREYPGLGWVALHRQDAQLAFAPAKDLQHRILWVGGILGLFFVLIGWLQAGRIARPIQTLTEATEKVVAGNLKYEAPNIRGNDEVAYLATSIHEMTSALTHEISERKRAENKLRIISEAIEQAGEAVIITDQHGIIEYANPACCEITGYRLEELVGQTPSLLKSGEQDAAYYKVLWETITRGEVWHGTLIDRKKDGSHFPALMSIAPVSTDGVITHFVSIQQDMTEHKKLEQQFFQAQKMEAIGTLVGGVAHDFNNILAGLSGNIYLAKSSSDTTPKMGQYLTTAEDLVERAADLIRQLLTFARKGHVKMSPISLTEITEEALSLLRVSTPENIVMCHELCSEPLMVNGNATQLHQVLANLLINASDAVINSSNPSITITLNRFDTDKTWLKNHANFEKRGYAHLSVTDNGYGISEASIEHLFEPFFTTKQQGKGTGLGLSMVFGAIKAHEGFIEVKSKNGKGASFHIYIPLLEGNAGVVAEPQTQPLVQGNNELILVVDDDLRVIEVTKQLVESLGYRVVVASDGLEAVSQFEGHQQEIALVILDVVMPNLGGVEAYQRITELRPDTKVIFLSGYDQGKIPLVGHTILSKPCNIYTLSDAIREKLNA